jgi:hypothetical protein
MHEGMHKGMSSDVVGLINGDCCVRLRAVLPVPRQPGSEDTGWKVKTVLLAKEKRSIIGINTTGITVLYPEPLFSKGLLPTIVPSYQLLSTGDWMV